VQLAEFAGIGTGGMYVHRPPFPPTLLIEAGRQLEVGSIKHELAHDLSFWFLPVQPTWYSEGIATFLETVRYDRAKGLVFVGEPSTMRLAAMRHDGVEPMERLFGPMPKEDFKGWPFENSSWILVHYLVNHRAEAFKAFQRRLDKLEPVVEAWRAEFPDLDAIGLNRTLVEYAHSGSYAIRYIPLAPWSGSTDVRLLSDAEVHGVLAYLYASVHPPDEPVNLAAARNEVDEALRGDPSALDASAMAFYLPALGIATSRPELARRAAAVHPESWLAWQMVADSTPPGDPAKLTALTRALEVAPDQPEALTRMAILKAGAGSWDEALSFSAKALRARAVPTDVWLIHLAALAHTGHCPEAALWAAAITRRLPSAQAGVVAQEWKGLGIVCTSPSVASPPASVGGH
jgi:tetratricopeptide (TPR) repeat protein